MNWREFVSEWARLSAILLTVLAVLVLLTGNGFGGDQIFTGWDGLLT